MRGRGLGLGAAQAREQAFMVWSWGELRACLGRAGWMEGSGGGVTRGGGAAGRGRGQEPGSSRLGLSTVEVSALSRGGSWTECWRLWGLGCPLVMPPS